MDNRVISNINIPTIDELIDEGSLCRYCSRTDYGEASIFCEDDGECEFAYDYYLDANEEEE